MKVSVIQMDIAWNDVEANLHRVGQLVDSVEGDTDLIVLPEMFSTGFAINPQGVAEREGGATLQWMERTARQHQCAVAGSVAVDTGQDYFNRFYFVGPQGAISIYDKRHLFAFGGEDKHFRAGCGRTVVEYGGVRFLLQVCYDLRFPVFSRNQGDYDAILYVANWPVARIEVWKTLLRARAIENQCYVVGVNRIGTDPYCEYPGCSMMVDAYGRIVAQCADNKEGTATAELRLEALRNFRQKFPVLKDADLFKLLYTRAPEEIDTKTL